MQGYELTLRKKGSRKFIIRITDYSQYRNLHVLQEETKLRKKTKSDMSSK